MKAANMFAEIMPRDMNPSGLAQKSNFHRSYFVLDNSPNSDYIDSERPGRRPNPAPLIDIVNLILAQPFNHEWAKTVAAYAARKEMKPTHDLAGRYFIDPLALLYTCQLTMCMPPASDASTAVSEKCTPFLM
jgi:hypothetical protein